MEKITDWTRLTLESLSVMLKTFMAALPNIFGAFVLILLGWTIAKLISLLIRRLLKMIHFDNLSKKLKLDELMGQVNVSIKPSQFVGKFVFWIILLFFFVTASETLGWAVVSGSISDLLRYMPKLFSGIVIFVIGLYIANFVKKTMIGIFKHMGLYSGNLISIFTFYIIITIFTLTALNQAGVDIQIITSNITIILGGFILAFAISFGFASRDILTNILSSMYTRNKFFAGQIIELDDVSGTIEKIDSTSCVIRTSDGQVIVPISRLLDGNVKIKNG